MGPGTFLTYATRVYDAGVRLFVVWCVLFAAAPAFAQPTPGTPTHPTAPTPAPAPAPSPTLPPDPGVPVPEPDPTDPSTPTPTPSTPAPSPAPQPLSVPAPAPKPSKQTATEARLAASALCAAQDASCDWLATFSSLEKSSIRRALAAAKLETEPSPWGKVIGRVRVHNEDVFAEANWLRFFNLFHMTTRDAYVRAELTIGEGEVWDDERIIESQRRVKDPLYTSIVALLPIKSAVPGTVDLLVVTRDIWSLRLNTQYTIQENSLTNLTVSISENNFLGRRKTLALSTIIDQGAIAAGPLYIDKNFLRTDQHFDLRMRIDRIFTRQALDVVTPLGERVPTGDPGGIQDEGKFRAEGSAATITLSRPLWALASKWAAGTSLSYRNAISRQYFGTGLRAYDDPDTQEVEVLPRHYRMKTWSTRVNSTRQWGRAYKHQIEAGYSVASQRPMRLPTSLASDDVLLAHFERDVFPRSEVVSGPYVEYSIFRAKFGVIRNVDTYELAEDVRYGPSFGVGLSQTLKTLGSDYRFTRPSMTAGWTIPWGRDGFARASAGGQLRIQGGDAIDNTATWLARAATPTLKYLRLIGQVQMDTRWDDRQNQFYTLGSDSGLRAYRIGQLIGDRRIVGQLEARSVPYPVWVVRLGGVAFYEAGGAANSFSQMNVFHDVGIGARMLLPQSSRELFRFDLAFPLVGTTGTRAGYPRFIAGFDSYF